MQLAEEKRREQVGTESSNEANLAPLESGLFSPNGKELGS
jgi:hypothetical protein